MGLLEVSEHFIHGGTRVWVALRHAHRQSQQVRLRVREEGERDARRAVRGIRERTEHSRALHGRGER